jgi:hypothetical protein
MKITELRCFSNPASLFSNPFKNSSAINLTTGKISLNINYRDYLLAGINYNAAHYYYPIKEIGAFALAQYNF